TVRCDNPTTALVEIRVTNNESFPIIAKAENSLFSLVVSSAWIQPGVTAYSGYGLNQSTTIGGGDVKFTITKTDDSDPYTFYVTFPEISCDPSSTISPTVSLTETPTVSPTVSPTETVTPTDNPGNSDSSDSSSCSNCGGNNININVEQQQQQQQVLAATVAPAPSTKQLPSTGAQDVAIIPTLLSLVAAGWKLRKLA
ncbi:MAG TPA: hypothetical protein VF189_01295, partial [Patescibacteria group bacterium]